MSNRRLDRVIQRLKLNGISGIAITLVVFSSVVFPGFLQGLFLVEIAESRGNPRHGLRRLNADTGGFLSKFAGEPC